MNQKPRYNPQIHHRRSIRLKGYDYSKEGLYFITICCENRLHRFGRIENGEMILNEYGRIAYDEWMKLTDRFSNFELDVFQIMPNHMHGIIGLINVDVDAVGAVGAGFTPALNKQEGQQEEEIEEEGQPQGLPPQGLPPTVAPTTPTIGDIVGAYKSLVANACLEIFKSKNRTMGKLWQRNYYEHIIRDERAYKTISEYIINNPAKWTEDMFHK